MVGLSEVLFPTQIGLVVKPLDLTRSIIVRLGYCVGCSTAMGTIL